VLRSVIVLNRGGVRLGTAELFAVVEGGPGIVDSLVVYLERGGDGPGRTGRESSHRRIWAGIVATGATNPAQMVVGEGPSRALAREGGHCAPRRSNTGDLGARRAQIADAGGAAAVAQVDFE
jgi:hypothetical protein